MKTVRMCLGVMAVLALAVAPSAASKRDRNGVSAPAEAIPSSGKSVAGPKVRVHLLAREGATRRLPGDNLTAGIRADQGRVSRPRVRVHIVARADAGPAPQVVRTSRPRFRVHLYTSESARPSDGLRGASGRTRD